MPLDDDYQIERTLKQLSNEIAPAITDAFNELGINETTGFILFIVDFNTGILQYVSDMGRDDVAVALKAHLAREMQ